MVASLSPEGAGISEAVPKLASEAVRLGHQATIATVARSSEPLSKSAEKAEAAGVRIVRFVPSFPAAAYASWEMVAGVKPLRRFVAEADVVHVHSNWTFPVWWSCSVALRQGKPLVMSPRGCLDPVRLAHSAWKKRVVAPLDRRCLRKAAAIHATSNAEREWIRAFLGHRARQPRIEVIPNGVELPPIATTASTSAKAEDRVRTVLALGRLHPLKGLDLLLQAWSRLSAERQLHGGWRLVIAGPDEQRTRIRLEELAQSLGLRDVEFLGPAYGDDKARLLRQADLVAVPSRSESFGNTVAEALAMEIPVITTTATPWAEIDGLCGWCVAPATEPIAQALATAMQLSDGERAALGLRGRRLMQENYSWASVGQAMERLYESVASGERA